MDKELVSMLFETNAFKVAPADKPFWYTSGKLGPYFINADYLYGSAEDSAKLLEKINNLLETTDKEEIPYEMYEEIMEHYDNNKIFKTTIDKLVNYIRENFSLSTIDYISGGERRDWPFSIPVTNLLGKPHITIYKDLTTVVSTCDFEEATTVTSLQGKNILHIADLLNFGSSFERAWAPAISNLGSKLAWALSVVNRNPKVGTKVLENLDIVPHALIELNEHFFDITKSKGIINEEQEKVLLKYLDDPDESMQEFINEHPTFIDDVINNSTDEKAVKRAKLCKEKKWYN